MPSSLIRRGVLILTRSIDKPLVNYADDAKRYNMLACDKVKPVYKMWEWRWFLKQYLDELCSSDIKICRVHIEQEKLQEEQLCALVLKLTQVGKKNIIGYSDLRSVAQFDRVLVFKTAGWGFDPSLARFCSNKKERTTLLTSAARKIRQNSRWPRQETIMPKRVKRRNPRWQHTQCNKVFMTEDMVGHKLGELSLN